MPKNCNAGPMFPPNTVLPLQPERGESFPVVIRPDCTRPPATVLPVLPDYRPAPTTLRKHVEDFGDPHHTMDLVRPHVETVTRAVESRVAALEAKSELDPQFGAWKTDVLPGLLAGKVDAALVDVRGLGTDKRVAIGEGADASGGPGHPVRAVAVGSDAKATGPVATAVGGETRATADSSAAFGSGAESTAPGAVQLGDGVNATGRSLQFRGANLFEVEASSTSVATLGAGFPKASKTVFGAMKAGDNLSVADGVVSAVVPTKTSQLENDSNFASDVLGRACVHTYNDPNVPPMAGARLSADEWVFRYREHNLGPDLHLRFYPDAGEWKIGFIDGSGHFVQMSRTIRAGADASSLDFGQYDGAVTFSGVDDRVVHESRLPTKTSQLENDSGFVTSVPTKTSQLENDSGFLTSVPTGADIRTSAEDGRTVADSLAAKADKLTDEQKRLLDGGPYVSTRGGMVFSDGNVVNLFIGGELAGWFGEPRKYSPGVLSVDGSRFPDEEGEFVPASILKDGVEVATEEQVNAVSDKVDDIKSTVSTDNRFLVDGTTAAIQTRESEGAEWTNEIRIDKGYDAVQGSTMVKLDKSVQTVTVAGGTLTVELPDAVDGTVRDLCLYVNNTSSTETVTMEFPSGVTVYKSKGGDDPKAAAQAGGVTAYYFTEIPGGAWRVMRDELEVAE